MNAPVRCHRCGQTLAVIDWDAPKAATASDRIIARHAADCMPPRPTLTCKEPGCDRPSAVKGWCQSHYKAHWRKNRSGPPCAVDGCDRKATTKGWCGMHHQRWARHGDPTYTVYGDKAAPDATPAPEVVVTLRKGREPLRCPDCGQPIAATKDLTPALAADARTNHARYCGRQEQTA